MTEMRAVLQLCPSLKEGGVERSTLEMAAYLAAHGWAPHVAAHPGPRVFALDPKVCFHPLPLHRRDPFSLLYCGWQLARLVKKNDIRLIHARSRGPAWAARLASLWTGVPFITTFHGTYGLKGWGKKWYNSVMVKGRIVIANSRFIQQHIADNYGIPLDDIPVAPRGYDPELFNPDTLDAAALTRLREELKISADVPVIVMVGRLARWKGQHILLEALASLTDHPWVALFAGGADKRGLYAEDLKRQTRRLGLEDRVRWLGSRQDVPALYKLADVAVSASTEPEAFGRVAVEAQAMGTPVIATAHGGSLETVQDGITGWLILPQDAAALAQTLDKALTNPAQLTKMGKDARQWVAAHFTTLLTCQKETAVYEHILKEEGANARNEEKL